MKKNREMLCQVFCFFEVFVGIIATIPIFIAIIGLLLDMRTLSYGSEDIISTFIYPAFGIIIAIEFIKLIFVHTIDATVEVIIMAIIRQIIVEHTVASDTFMLVLSVGILFMVRKFLFIRQLDNMDSHSAKES